MKSKVEEREKNQRRKSGKEGEKAKEIKEETNVIRKEGEESEKLIGNRKERAPCKRMREKNLTAKMELPCKEKNKKN